MRQDSGIGVLDKAVSVLHVIAESPCGLADLCERTGLPRATAHRLAAGLEVHRLLARDAEGRWRLGPAHQRAGRPGQRSAARRRCGRTAAAARDHRRERADLPPRGHVADLRGRPRTACGTSRYRPDRRQHADDGRFRRQSAAGLQRPRHAAGGAAEREIHRPGAGRSAQARLGAERRRTRTRGGQRVRTRPRRQGRGDRGDLGVRAHRPDGPAPRRPLGGRSAGGRAMR